MTAKEKNMFTNPYLHLCVSSKQNPMHLNSHVGVSTQKRVDFPCLWTRKSTIRNITCKNTKNTFKIGLTRQHTLLCCPLYLQFENNLQKSLCLTEER